MFGNIVGPVTPGAPVVYVAAFIALTLVVFTATWAESLVTVAHEGGHVVVAVLCGRSPVDFAVQENTGGGVTRYGGGWGVGLVLVSLAGYPTPPLLGLAGATLVLAGKTWSVLWASVFLLIGSLLHARDLFTNLIIVLALVGVGWVAIFGNPGIQSLVSVTLVWWMLFGGVRQLLGQGLGVKGSDAADLSRRTWIPAIAWVALFWFISIICLWVGGRRLIGF